MQVNQVKTAKQNEVLRKGSNFSDWTRMLKAALMEKDVLGHVFHDISWCIPSPKPMIETPAEAGPSPLQIWHQQDLIAYGIVIRRIDQSLRPNFGDTEKTAKELYDTVAAAYRPVVTINIHDRLKTLGISNIKIQATNTLID